MPPPRIAPAETAGASSPTLPPVATAARWKVGVDEGERDVLGGQLGEGEGVDVAETLRLALGYGVFEGVELCEAPVEGVPDGVGVTDAVRDALTEAEGVMEMVGEAEGVGEGEGAGTPPLVAFEMYATPFTQVGHGRPSAPCAKAAHGEKKAERKVSDGRLPKMIESVRVVALTRCTEL